MSENESFIKLKLKLPFKLLLILFTGIITLNNCATYDPGTSKKWKSYKLSESKIRTNGSVFLFGKQTNKEIFSVYYDYLIDKNTELYYRMLMRDCGWILEEDVWTATKDSKNLKSGHIYISTQRKVAIYVYPNFSYSAFKLRLH